MRVLPISHPDDPYLPSDLVRAPFAEAADHTAILAATAAAMRDRASRDPWLDYYTPPLAADQRTAPATRPTQMPLTDTDRVPARVTAIGAARRALRRRALSSHLSAA